MRIRNPGYCKRWIENDLEYGFDRGPAGVASHVDDDSESHLSHLVAETKNKIF